MADKASAQANCRFCGTSLRHTFVDLGMSPLCESFLRHDQLNLMEPFYPLKVHLCSECFLVQLEEYVSPDKIFSEYAYFSSYSDSWLEHCKRYTDTIVNRLNLTSKSRVLEIASNDGYLLQYFVKKGVPVLGVEPAANVAAVATQRGVPSVVEFFGTPLAQKLTETYGQADLIIGNNVLAQVPDLNDFVAGMATVLKPDGVINMEFPHLLHLIEQNQFDTIYHEHFSYFSLLTAQRIFSAHGLRIFDVDELPTHGGSLRIYACHASDTSRPTVSDRALTLLQRERDSGLTDVSQYQRFQEKVKDTKRKLLQFLIEAKANGKSVVGYGAPGKGNTLLNYCGIRTDFLDYTVDRNPYKHGKHLPGTHVPIFEVEKIRHTKPDYVLILPWNFKDEIMQQMGFVKEWGAKFVVPIPEVKVYA